MFSVKRRALQQVVTIGLTVQDMDYIIKLLDNEKQRAAEQLHKFAMQSDQRQLL
jgi:hypothetical protein